MDSIRSLVDVILAVTGQPKRVKVDARMCDQIRSLTLVDHKTAAEIAAVAADAEIRALEAKAEIRVEGPVLA